MANRLKRIHNLVYVMTPTEGVTEKDVVDITRRGCRQAMVNGYEPISPYLHYGVFMGQDELTSVRMKKRCLYWLNYCTKIWVCLKDNELPALDTLSHDILLHSTFHGMRPRLRRDPHKLPITFVWWDDLYQHLYMKIATPQRLQRWLICNISSRIIMEEEDDDC
jgi:hypothetical protein